MKADEYREEFQSKCFKPALENMLAGTAESLTKNAEEICPMLVKPIAHFLEQVLRLKKEGKIEKAACISLSFLRTSMCEGKPVILAEAYEGIPFLSASEYSKEISVDWMFPCWKEYQEEIEDRTKKEILGRYIRTPELRSYESQAVSTVLRFLLFYLKYMIRNLEEEAVWEKLSQNSELMISFGEYMDWQLPIAAVRPEIDLFLCDKEEDLTFREFREMYYRDKLFEDWVLDDCVFIKCTFYRVTFRGTCLRNTRFLECRFEECWFEDVQLMGTSILSSHLHKVDFVRCSMMSGWQEAAGYMQLFAAGKLIGSKLHQVQWIDMELPEDVCFD